MRPLFIAFFTFLFTWNSLLAQKESLIDSLKVLLTASYQDTNKVNLLNELAFLLRYQDKSKALLMALEADSLSSLLSFRKGLANSLVIRGIIAKNAGEYIKAENYYTQGLKIRQELKDIQGIASIYNNLGTLYKIQNQSNNAKKNYGAALKVLRPLKDSGLKAKVHNNLSSIFRRETEFNNAIAHLDSSYQIHDKLNIEGRKASTLLNMGTLFQDLKNWDKAIDCYNRSLELYTQQSNKTGIAKCHINLGNMALKKGNYLNSIAYYEKAIEAKDMLTKDEQALLYKNQGIILKKISQPEEAIRNYQISQKIFASLHNQREWNGIHYEIGSFSFYGIE